MLIVAMTSLVVSCLQSSTCMLTSYIYQLYYNQPFQKVIMLPSLLNAYFYNLTLLRTAEDLK